MRHQNLRIKVGLYLAIALSPAMILIPYLIVNHNQEHLQGEIAGHAMQISDVIVKSTRYAMLINERDFAAKIVEDIGKQKGIERVRILSKDGKIIHSSRTAEIGRSVNQQAEPCLHCHLTSKPLERVADDKRWRTYKSGDGHRLLGAMAAIRNEPTCSTASCHEHPASQSVLGIVDIAYSLDEIDSSLNMHAMYLIGITLAVILLVAACVGFLLQRLIYLPLKDLESGAAKISAGDLVHKIPIRSNDELGRVAGSFNQMTSALQKSRSELEELVLTLESKVEKRTQELRIAEAEVAQGEKLASVGMLASGVAHELNNPLTGVLTFTSLLRRKMPDGSQDAEDLDLVIRETKRCASIIRRLLDFAREKVPVNGLFNLNHLIEDTVRFVDRPASLQNIEIKLDLAADLPQVWGDADLIKQVILNIVVNAQQAIEDRGTIRVESRRIVVSPGAGGEQAAPIVEIAVSDTGCGIPDANLQRIFDPFFTSKEVGKGTGLGLSVSHGIVKAHGGKILVESTVGVGTTFRIQLPIESPFGNVDNNAGETTT